MQPDLAPPVDPAVYLHDCFGVKPDGPSPASFPVQGGKNGTLWEHYPTMRSAAQAASDHAAIYADLDL